MCVFFFSLTFGFEDGILDMIVVVPEHCLSLYFEDEELIYSVVTKIHLNNRPICFMEARALRRHPDQ